MFAGPDLHTVTNQQLLRQYYLFHASWLYTITNAGHATDRKPVKLKSECDKIAVFLGWK